MTASFGFDEPMSAAAVWSRRTGLFSVATTLVALAAWRGGSLEAASGFAALGAGLALAALALVLGIVAVIAIWIRGLGGGRSAVVGLVAAVAILALPVASIVQGLGRPYINDVTTDPGDPPAFVFAAADRHAGDADPAYPGPRAAMAQLSAYPAIQALHLALGPDEAYALAVQIVRDRGWRILDDGTADPDPRRRIEAVARTPVLGLRQDVVIRLRAEDDGSRVDIRSAARFPGPDLGADAERVQRFLADLAAAAN